MKNINWLSQAIRIYLSICVWIFVSAIHWELASPLWLLTSHVAAVGFKLLRWADVKLMDLITGDDPYGLKSTKRKDDDHE